MTPLADTGVETCSCYGEALAVGAMSVGIVHCSNGPFPICLYGMVTHLAVFDPVVLGSGYYGGSDGKAPEHRCWPSFPSCSG